MRPRALFLVHMFEKPHYDEKPFGTSRRVSSGRARRGGGVVEFLVILIVSFALVFGVVRPFIVEAFWIPSASMVPTLLIDDRVLVNKFIYRFEEPERGDVIVFESVDAPPVAPASGPVEAVRRFLGLEADTTDDLIKRVIGVEGDTIAVRNGRLLLNGEPQREPYVNERFLRSQAPYGPTEVPEGHVFAMGDNRANSQDSRVFGTVPKENIEGEAFLRFWPPSRLGLL